jgi:DNA-binding MarR family transcriptional regulator
VAIVPTVPLALLLLRASRWFDRQLLERLAERGWPALTPAQSLVFAHLDPEGVPPAELARRLGTSRQSTQDLVAGLVARGLLVLASNPLRRGGRLVTMTEQGRALAGDSRRIQEALERDLGERRVSDLRALLQDFGELSSDPVPASPPTTSTVRRRGTERGSQQAQRSRS